MAYSRAYKNDKYCKKNKNKEKQHDIIDTSYNWKKIKIVKNYLYTNRIGTCSIYIK